MVRQGSKPVAFRVYPATKKKLQRMKRETGLSISDLLRGALYRTEVGTFPNVRVLVEKDEVNE